MEIGQRGFYSRREAGQRLAQALLTYQHCREVWVLALPRGGVPVAYEVAIALGAPLEVWVVRKLGVPGQAELAMGAIAAGGVCLLNRPLIEKLGIDDTALRQVIAAEQQELIRRQHCYRGDRPRNLHNQTVILVDDGIATGFTCRAAIAALRQQQPARLILATPVAAPSALESLAPWVDQTVSLLQPARLGAISLWYTQFGQTTDEEVRRLLEAVISHRSRTDN